jgi:CHAT domain-containing protein
MVQRERQSAPARADIVALGHQGTTQWDVEYELRDIRAFDKDARLYFQKQATLATLQREHGTILHLAAEFSFDPDVPRNSVFLLSDGQGSTPQRFQWGLLLSLPVFPTVVLSDLGLHESAPIAHAELFLIGGSKSVVTTLYSAQRRTKKYFGELFYTAVLGGSSTEDSYRSALLGMITTPEYSAPSVWAPFVLWGK